MMYNKWWKRDGEKTCPKNDNDPSKASALNVVNIGGVFVVLLCGLTFAILVSVAEFYIGVNWGDEPHPAMKGRGTPGRTSGFHSFRTSRLLLCGQREAKGTIDCYSCQEGQGVRYL